MRARDVLSARFKPYHVPLFLAKYAWLAARRRPVLVHFEVTLRCNARCGFCDYWKTPAEARARRARLASPTRRASSIRCSSPSPAASRCCGAISRSSSPRVDARGPPQVHHADHARRDAHAGARASSLWDAGINQFNISLDYLDGRHDAARGIPGLSSTRSSAPSTAMRARGIDNIRFNTVIKDDNLDQLLPIVRARRGARLRRELQRLHRLQERQPRTTWCATRSIAELDDAHRASCSPTSARRRGVITNSDYYLEQIPRYVRGEMTEPCRVRRCARSTSIRPAT